MSSDYTDDIICDKCREHYCECCGHTCGYDNCGEPITNPTPAERVREALEGIQPGPTRIFVEEQHADDCCSHEGYQLYIKVLNGWGTHPFFTTKADLESVIATIKALGFYEATAEEIAAELQYTAYLQRLGFKELNK